jgi:hypothetical protein
VQQFIVWRSVKAVSALRKEYVPAYVRCLQAGKVGGDEAIAAMDAQLDEHVIQLFRWAVRIRAGQIASRAAELGVLGGVCSVMRVIVCSGARGEGQEGAMRSVLGRGGGLGPAAGGGPDGGPGVD